VRSPAPVARVSPRVARGSDHGGTEPLSSLPGRDARGREGADEGLEGRWHGEGWGNSGGGTAGGATRDWSARALLVDYQWNCNNSGEYEDTIQLLV
jgi:hypothetical protein